MNITLKQLRALVAVARAGSFTRAAERLFITQSALSGLIKELEQSMGLRLINRSTRRMELSEVGRELYPLIAKTLQDLDNTLSEAQNIKNLQKGTVRVAVPQLLACTLLPEAIAAFRSTHPQIQVQVVDAMIEKVIPRVLSGEVDFGAGPEREATPEIATELLISLPFMAACPPEHPLATQRRIRWSQLARYPVISLRGQFTERLSLDLQQAARDIQPHTEVTFMSTALAMVHNRLGITICLPYAASLAQQYGLELRSISDPVVNRNFHLFQRKGATLSPAAQGFRDFFAQFVAGHHRNESTRKPKLAPAIP